MVGKIKLNAQLIDKHKIFPMKGKYDPETRLLEVKRGRLSRDIFRFLVDPDHIYEQVKMGGLSRKYVVFVDNANRQSVELKRVKQIIEDGVKREETVKEKVEVGSSVKVHSDDPIDMKKANALDVHAERGFWKALMQQSKIPVTTVLIMLLAGAGLYHVLLVVLRVFGFQV